MKEGKKIIVSVTATVKEDLRQNTNMTYRNYIFTERNQCIHYCINGLFIINRNNIIFSYSLLSLQYYYFFYIISEILTLTPRTAICKYSSGFG